MSKNNIPYDPIDDLCENQVKKEENTNKDREKALKKSLENRNITTLMRCIGASQKMNKYNHISLTASFLDSFVDDSFLNDIVTYIKSIGGSVTTKTKRIFSKKYVRVNISIPSYIDSNTVINVLSIFQGQLVYSYSHS